MQNYESQSTQKQVSSDVEDCLDIVILTDPLIQLVKQPSNADSKMEVMIVIQEELPDLMKNQYCEVRHSPEIFCICYTPS